MGAEWIECALIDACSSVDYGLTASATHSNVGPKFLRITDIVPGHIDWNNVPNVVADAKTIEKYRLNAGDIVLARTGASTGVSAYVKNPPLAVFASYLVRLKVKPEFDPRFVAYYLKSEYFWTFIRGVLGDKSAQPNASASTMTKAPFRAPRNKDAQRAIAHILGTLDDKIELNRKMNQTLEAIARAIFKSWFVDFDPVIYNALAAGKPIPEKFAERAARRAQLAQGKSSLPENIRRLFPDEFQNSELGPIPDGWETGLVKDLATVSSGKRPNIRYPKPSASAHVPLWGGNGPMAFVPEALTNSPILLTGRVGTLGSVFRITTPCWPSDNTLILSPKSAAAFEYLFFQLQQIDFTALNRGSTQPLLTQTDLKAQPLLLPPEKAIRQFQVFAGTLYTCIDRLENESTIITALRNTLLPKLISGEIQVKDTKYLIVRGCLI